MHRDDGTITVERPSDSASTARCTVSPGPCFNNMVVGVTDGFRKNLEIHGVGYRAAMDGKMLVLNVGYFASGADDAAGWDHLYR